MVLQVMDRDWQTLVVTNTVGSLGNKNFTVNYYTITIFGAKNFFILKKRYSSSCRKIGLLPLLNFTYLFGYKYLCNMLNNVNKNGILL